MAGREFRRFNTKDGHSGQVRQLQPDPLGSFMLYSDHSGAVEAVRRKLEGQLHEANWQTRQLQDEVALLKRQLADAKAQANNDRGAPDWWAVMHRGTAIEVYPTKELANAAALVTAYTSNHGTDEYVLEPMWGPV